MASNEYKHPPTPTSSTPPAIRACIVPLSSPAERVLRADQRVHGDMLLLCISAKIQTLLMFPTTPIVLSSSDLSGSIYINPKQH